MLSINTNLGAFIVQSSLNVSTNGLNQAIERMSTGFKINHAKDNAAGYSIATKLSSQLSSYDVALDNASMGLDMVMTAMDSLELISSHLSRMRDLAEQAANGTYGEDSLKAIQSEIDARKAEIERIVANTEYNGINLFSLQPDGNNSSSNLPSSGEFLESITQLSESDAVNAGYTVIKTIDDLKAISSSSSRKFILMNDLDLSGENWSGLVLSSEAEFNGNGYVIRNIRGESLFSALGICSTIINLGLENVNVHSAGGTACGLAQVIGNNARISNCYITGSVTGDKAYGLAQIIGGSAKISNLNFSVKVEGQTGSAILADFIGQYASFSKSWYNGSLNSGMQLVNQTSINVDISGLQDNSPPTPLTSKEIVFQVGINSDKSSSITVDVGIGEIDLNIDVTTPDGARNALTTLDEYLKSINEKQTELGSA